MWFKTLNKNIYINNIVNIIEIYKFIGGYPLINWVALFQNQLEI